MAVGYRSSSNTGTSDQLVSSINVPVPSGAAANDIALVALEMWESANPTVTAPSGFTLLTSQVSGSQKLKIWWKRLTGADTGNYSFSWTGSQWTLGHCVLLTGAVTSGDPIGSNFNSASATSTNIPTTSVTVAFQPGLVCFVANENSATQTPPTSFTEVQDGNYLHTSYRIPGSTGSFSASGGTLTASTLILATLVAVQPAGGGSSTAANTATETDASQSLGKSKRKTANLLTESDSAIAVARSKARGSSLAAETDSALGFTRRKAKAASQGQESDTALPIGRTRSRAAGLTTETETALPIGRVKRRTVTVASESDAAFAIGSTSGISQPVQTAASSEAALPIGYRRSRAIGPALELSTANPVEFLSPAWRLVVPTIQEKYALPSTRGALLVSNYREVTVFGDDDDLFTTALGVPSEGTDEYGAIPFGTKYIWYGGHVNTTDDPAIRDLWLAHGFEVENVQL
jgi:hypothetical protein